MRHRGGGLVPRVREGYDPPAMKELIAFVLLVLALAAGVAGYRELTAAGHGGATSVADPAGWQVVFADGRSRILRRETLRIIVISRKRTSFANDGRTLQVSGHSLQGWGQIYLIDEEGRLTETRAPLFEEFWSRRGDFSLRVDAWNGPAARKHQIREYLRATLKPETWDPPLRDFFGPPEKSP